VSEVPRRSFYDPEGSFWEKVDRTHGEDGCWIWTRATRAGYGHLKVGRKGVSAHRYSYELAYGSIPEDMIICHRCNQRLCVNPKHLYAGTYKDNIQDLIAAGMHTSMPPASRGEANGQAVLTEDEVLDIYERAWSGESGKSLAKEYGVNKRTISNIKHGVNWAWLTGHQLKKK
jgi:HNH endonuclease